MLTDEELGRTPQNSSAAWHKSKTAHLGKWLHLPLTGRLATGLQQSPCISRVGTYNNCMHVIYWPAQGKSEKSARAAAEAESSELAKVASSDSVKSATVAVYGEIVRHVVALGQGCLQSVDRGRTI